jgi:hypothetical protein
MSNLKSWGQDCSTHILKSLLSWLETNKSHYENHCQETGYMWACPASPVLNWASQDLCTTTTTTPCLAANKNSRERTLSSEDWTATLLYCGVWRTQREQLSHDLKHMGKDLRFVGKCTSSMSTASPSPGVLDQEQRQQLLITGPLLYEWHNTVLLTFQNSWQGNRNFRAEKSVLQHHEISNYMNWGGWNYASSFEAEIPRWLLKKDSWNPTLVITTPSKQDSTHLC